MSKQNQISVLYTLIVEMLGTKAASDTVFADFVAKKAPTVIKRHEEVETHEEMKARMEQREEAGSTIFHRMTRARMFKLGMLPEAPSPETADQLVIGIYDYQVKGFFKEACGIMNRADAEYRVDTDGRTDADGKPVVLEKLTAYKTKIDGLIFVTPRFIPIILPEGEDTGICERPLRAETAQGPRVTVVRSETVPEGSTMQCTIETMSRDLMPYIKLWLKYGARKGFGQWRNSGRGSFFYKILDLEEIPPSAAK